MAQKSRWTLPEVVNPPGKLCFTIHVPNERYHIAAFLGAIYELAKPYSWQNDPAHTAIDVGTVWRDIFYSLTSSACDIPCPIPIDEMAVDMSVCEQIRYNPATNKFEGLCCGVWSVISGQPTGGFALAPTAQGAPLPAAGGGCQIYQGSLDANGQWLSPAPINAGDTIQIMSINGAWTDGGANWYCPTGTIFYGGLCTVGSGVNGADPLPASPHMGLISKIAGAFHYLGDLASFTVPGGVSNKLLILQANDATFADNYGQITFQIKICNNQPATWSSLLDFRISNYGSYNRFATAYAATYTPGIGWTFPLPVDSGGTSVEIDFASSTITGLQTTIVANSVALPSGGTIRARAIATPIIDPLVVAGSGTQVKTYSNPAGLAAITDIDWTQASGGAPSGSGSWVLQQALISGLGVKPATLP